jgi:nitroreductase
MLFKTVLFLVLLICCIISASEALADLKLPDPKKEGGDGIFSLLEKRASGSRGNFPKGKISLDELSSVLWAASGLNRGGKGWTVPMAGGMPPYVKIYAVMSDGAFIYDWKAHLLSEVTDKNVLGEITEDDFVKEASCVLIFVSDTGDLGNMSSLNAGNTLAYIASGAMTQNAYLAAAALGIGGRYMLTMNTDAVKRALKLGNTDSPLCIMPLGKY